MLIIIYFIIYYYFSLCEDRWKGDISAQKLFLDKIALRKNFHPTEEAHRWCTIPKHEVFGFKVSNPQKLGHKYVRS